MKRVWIVLFSVIVFPALADVIPELPDLIEKLYPSIVVVHATKTENNQRLMAFGTAVLVDKRGYFLSSLHNVDGLLDPSISVDGVTQIPVTIEAKSSPYDLVLLKANLPGNFVGKPWLPPKEYKYRLGTPVVALGHPMGNHFTVTKGILSGLRRKKVVKGVEFTLHQTDAAINPGNSGGPIFTEKGEWIGVAFGIEANAHGLAFFIPIKPVSDFLAENLVAAEPGQK